MAVPERARVHARGFTLVELSIVLVIVGLIVGGVLMGADMVRQAQMRKIVQTVDSYKAAAYAFKNKYNGFPGDILNATQYFAGAANGNNNGTVDTTGESQQFWLQLSAAGLIPGQYDGSSAANYLPGTNIPGDATLAYVYRCAPSVTTFTVYAKPDCFFSVGNFQNLANDWSGNPIASPDEGRAFDQKFDDGNPARGGIYGARSSNYSTNWCTDNDAYAAATTTANYISGSTKQCVFLFRFP